MANDIQIALLILLGLLFLALLRSVLLEIENDPIFRLDKTDTRKRSGTPATPRS